jgi:hypothetical protein
VHDAKYAINDALLITVHVAPRDRELTIDVPLPSAHEAPYSLRRADDDVPQRLQRADDDTPQRLQRLNNDHQDPVSVLNECLLIRIRWLEITHLNCNFALEIGQA